MQRATIASTIVVICALAWAYLIHLHGRMSSSETAMTNMGTMINASWTLADALFTFTMWAVMMVGMMSATATPMILLFAGSQARRATRGSSAMVALFGLGYIIVWVEFSAIATVAQWLLHRAALLSPMMATTSPRLAGIVLIAAGAYQLTPAKRACLEHCQSPLDFVMRHWRDGPVGALEMGLRHGLYCVGCCWALMGVLFAVGVMNLAWVALLTVFILAERLGSGGIRVARAGGLLMVGLGVMFFAGLVPPALR